MSNTVETSKMNGTTSPKSSPSKKETDTATVAINHFAQGKRHLLVNDINSAVNSLQEACRLLAKQHGETAPECGDAYFYYGRALLELARIENGVLGNALDGVPEGEDLDNSQVEDPEKMTEEECEMVTTKVTEALEENFQEHEKMSTKDKKEDKKDSDEGKADESKAEDKKDKEEDKKDKEEDKKDKEEDKKDKDEDKKDDKKDKEEDKKDSDESKSEDKKVEEMETETKSDKKLEKAEETSVKSEEKLEKKSEETKENGKSEKAASSDKKSVKESSSEKHVEVKEKEETSKKGETKKESKNEETNEKDESKKEEKSEGSEDKEDKEDEEMEEGDDDEDGEAENEEVEGEGTADEEPKENEQSQDEGDKTDDDDVSNLQLAWEMLELAKIIYKKQDDKHEMALKVAQSSLKLGEVGLESENYPQSIEDFKDCFTVQETILKPDDRCLAETHYQLGIAYSFADDFANAVSSFKGAVNVVETRITNLKNTMKDKESWTEEQKKKNAEEKTGVFGTEQSEIDELNLLLPEMKEKITDMEQMKKDSKDKLIQLAKDSASLAATIGGSSSSSSNGASTSKAENGFGSPSSSTTNGAKPIQNISHLIRKKRKPEEESTAEESKKAKGENGKAVTSPTKEDKTKEDKTKEDKTNGKSKSSPEKMETDSPAEKDKTEAAPSADELKMKISEDKEKKDVKA